MDLTLETLVTDLVSVPIIYVPVIIYLFMVVCTSFRFNSLPVKLFYQLKQLHNLILLVWSVVLAVGTTIEILNLSLNKYNGISWLVCYQSNHYEEHQMRSWFLIFLLSKFYELLDTFFTSSSTFLHVFHHSTVVIGTYFAYRWNGSVFVLASVVNAYVHIIMYYYYYQKAQFEMFINEYKGKPDALAVIKSVENSSLWFKRYITIIQITQFITTSLGVAYVFTLHAYDNSCIISYPLYFNAVLNVCYLLLFIKFYLRTYKSGKSE